MQAATFYLLLCVVAPSTSLHVENVHIKTDKVLQTINEMFVGVTIDTSQLTGGYSLDHLREPNLVPYTKALSPGYVRVGGTRGDQTDFGEHINSRFEIKPAVWDELNSFCRKTGLKLIFGLNIMDRKSGKWDSTNSLSLLQYSASKGYDIAGFELGNEPNLLYRFASENVTYAQLGADFQSLQEVLRKTPYKSSLLLGPDTAGYKDGAIKEFLSHGGDVVDVVTYHSYYFNGATAQLSDFYRAHTLDHITRDIKRAVALANSQTSPKVAWLGETSSAYGGGAEHLSDGYVAGIMWLDKLGLSALHGLKGVMRQSLYGGRYGLLQSTSNMEPNPDFWLTVLYKRLVGNKVFEVNTSSRNTRIYAHCTKRNNTFSYRPGSLTVYALNLNNASIILQFSQHGQKHVDVFWLTPERGDPLAQKVQLNGKTLAFSGEKLPSFTPHRVLSGSVTIPEKTFGFVVLPEANVAACKTPDHNTIIG